MRPTTFAANSVLSMIAISPPTKPSLRDQSHGLRALHQLQGALHDWRIDHLRAQAYDSQTFLLRLVVGRDDLPRALDFPRRRSECLVNDRNLQWVNAAHAFKAERARVQAPGAQAFHVADVAVRSEEHTSELQSP